MEDLPVVKRGRGHIVLSDVTPEQVEKLVAELQGNATHVASQGNGVYLIDGHGVKATANYKDGVFSILVTSKPFWMPYSAIEGGIENALGRRPPTPMPPAPAAPAPAAPVEPGGIVGPGGEPTPAPENPPA